MKSKPQKKSNPPSSNANNGNGPGFSASRIPVSVRSSKEKERAVGRNTEKVYNPPNEGIAAGKQMDGSAVGTGSSSIPRPQFPITRSRGNSILKTILGTAPQMENRGPPNQRQYSNMTGRNDGSKDPDRLRPLNPALRKGSPSCAANFPPLTSTPGQGVKQFPVSQEQGISDITPPLLLGSPTDNRSILTLHGPSNKGSEMSVECLPDKEDHVKPLSGSKRNGPCPLPNLNKNKDAGSSPYSPRSKSFESLEVKIYDILSKFKLDSPRGRSPACESESESGKSSRSSSKDARNHPKFEFNYPKRKCTKNTEPPAVQAPPTAPPMTPPPNDNYGLAVIEDGKPRRKETTTILTCVNQNESGQNPSTQRPDERHPTFKIVPSSLPPIEHSAFLGSTAVAQRPDNTTPASLDQRLRTLPPSALQQARARARENSYESRFYQKKAFDKMGPTAMRSASREHAVSPFVPSTPLPTSGSPRLTKVITRVMEEYEEEEEESSMKTKKTNKVTNNSGANKSRNKVSPRPTIKSKSPNSKANKTDAKAVPKKATAGRVAFTEKKAVKAATDNNGNIQSGDAKGSKNPSRTSNNRSRSRGSSVTPPFSLPSDDDYRDTVSPTASSALPPTPTISKPPPSPKAPLNSAANRSRSISSSGRGVKTPTTEVVLPGHGDPHLEQLPEKTSDTEKFVQLEDYFKNSLQDEAIQALEDAWSAKYKKLRNMLGQSERTVRYLNELLAVKEEELFNIKKGLGLAASGDNWHTKDRSTNTSKRQSTLAFNPLLTKGSEYNGSSPPTNVYGSSPPRAPLAKPTTTTTSYSIPKFDVDEFIRKFLSHILCKDDYIKLNQSEPFETIQVFRAAVAARDCMAQSVKEKLKYGYHVLKRQYEIILSMKAASTEPLDEAYYIQLVDRHRRFVRFIYYYLKTSLQDVENFEQMYIPLQSRITTSHPMKYSQQTTMTLGGVHYAGVFIPIHEISRKKGR